jgi:uncharacterized protein (DUF433 family)
MITRVRDTGRTLGRIRDTGRTLAAPDTKDLAKTLGASEVVIMRRAPRDTRSMAELRTPGGEAAMSLAMATAARVVYSHITKQPGVRGGRACIDATRIAAVDIAAVLEAGKTPEMVCAVYPSLSLAQIHAAISYYYENGQAIEAELAEDADWEQEHERCRAEYLARSAR